MWKKKKKKALKFKKKLISSIKAKKPLGETQCLGINLTVDSNTVYKIEIGAVDKKEKTEIAKSRTVGQMIFRVFGFSMSRNVEKHIS